MQLWINLLVLCVDGHTVKSKLIQNLFATIKYIRIYSISQSWLLYQAGWCSANGVVSYQIVLASSIDSEVTATKQSAKEMVLGGGLATQDYGSAMLWNKAA
jgi:hypothetical protein